LQATVMLTIVRRKSDIPEERHKLFEKYVDVVFQREKTKNDLIARYEPELKLLHEMVGYQIHEAVARGEAGVLPEDKFKELVWTVWRLVRGDEQLQVVPNQEIQRIYELSTDRLVFLSGKGTKQSDIDFVIQPYREYFAASYISNHMEADPDKVFTCLVERGAYWQQVLRFYSAIAKPAQQLTWAYGAALPPSGLAWPDSLVKGLQTRRAVLFALPEFVRFQFEQLRNTISGCLPESEWWTWLGQEWAVPILGGLRNGEAWRELWKTFNRTADHSFGSRLFALWLFPRVIPANAPEYADFLGFVSAALADSKLAKQAIEVTLLYELPIDLDLVAEKTLFDGLDAVPYSGRLGHRTATRALLKRLSWPRALRFLCTSFQTYSGLDDGVSIWEFAGLPVEKTRSASPEVDTSGGPTIGICTPNWLSFSIHGQGRLPLAGSLGTEGVYAAYLRALFAALQQPDNPALYQKAKAAAMILPQPVAWWLSCESVLGQSPDQFRSSDDWSRYKAEMRDVFSKPSELTLLRSIASTFGAAGDKNANEWTVLLLPPSQWQCLVSEGLLPAGYVANLRTSRWAQTVSLSKGFIELATVFQEYSQISSSRCRIPFVKLMEIAVTLHNRGELFESDIAGETLRLADPTTIEADEIHGIIKKVQDPSKLPQSWVGSFFDVALRIEWIDLGLLSKFWAAVSDGREAPVWLRLGFHQAPWPQADSTAATLLELQDDASLDLATQILSRCPDRPAELLREMNRRAASGLLGGDLPEARRRTLVRCLLSSKPTLEEARLYGDLQSFKRIRDPNPARR
jgi:hypothetical protein